MQQVDMVRVNTLTLIFFGLLMGWLGESSTFAQSGRITRVYTLSDAEDGNPHAIWLKGLPRAAGSRRYTWVAPATFTSFSSGTTIITGQVANKTNPNNIWDVQFTLVNELGYPRWTAQGGEAYQGDAPAADVLANRQNWRFWELDSLQSFMVGATGSLYEGDTLFLSHRPRNRVHGFQFGQAANSKDTNFGISGWFYFSGAFSGAGDLVSNATCAPRPCNLDVSAQTVCTSDSTFTIEIRIDSGTNKITLVDDQGTAIRKNLSPGTYTYGSYSNQTVVSITFNDTKSANCETTITGLTNNCKPCDLQLISAEPRCIGNDSFLIDVTFLGTGNQFKIEDGLGTCLKRLQAGTYALGPYANDTQVDITVSDLSLTGCDTTVSNITTNCTPPCDLALVSVDPACINDDSFQITVVFTGTGNNFQLSDNQGNSLSGLTAGSYLLGTYANSTLVDITLNDLNIADCDTMVSGITEDCTPPPVCDLALVSVDPACINDDSFQITVVFTGTGNNFQLSDNQGNSRSGLTAGSYVLGTYPNGALVDITLNDLNIADCDTMVSGITEDCTPPLVCDLSVIEANPICTSDSTFRIDVTFTGTGSSFQITDDQGNTLTGLEAGTFSIGNYPNGTLVTITVSNPSAVNCDTTLTGLTADCSSIVCDLNLVDLVPICINNDSFVIEVTFTGSGDKYEIIDIADFLPNDTIEVGAANTTYIIGPYLSSTNVDVIVRDLRFANCTARMGPESADCTAPLVCDLSIDSLYTVCLTDSFDLFVIFSGTGGSNYAYFDNLGRFNATGIAPDTIRIGRYAAGESVGVTLSDTRILGCLVSSSLITEDCVTAAPPTNDLFDDAVEISCGDSYQGTLLGATAGDAPQYICSGESSVEGIWFKIVGTAENIKLAACAATPEEQVDMKVYYLAGGNLTCSGGVGQVSACTQAGIAYEFFSAPGETYYIYLYKSGGLARDFTLDISCSPFVFDQPSLFLNTSPNRIELSWSLEEEWVTDGFTIERQEANGPFIEIGFVPSLGNQGEPMSYTYVDDQIKSTYVYTYRVRQELADGRVVYSNLGSTNQLGKEVITISNPYPNPTRTSFFLDLVVPDAGEVAYQIVDARGRKLTHKIVTLDEGPQTLEIQANWLLSGVYLVHMTIGETTITRRLVVRR